MSKRTGELCRSTVKATPAAGYSDKHRAAITVAPLTRILLETDSPVAYEGRRSEPADVAKTLEAVARIKRVSEIEVAGVTTQNAAEFFGLHWEDARNEDPEKSAGSSNRDIDGHRITRGLDFPV
ncbi:MAG: TatD family hydrolase [Thermodesulfobacteriota bacterium]